METSPIQPPTTRRDKVLRQEVRACDDPICSCEAEPRWLRFEHDDDEKPGEWESLERSPKDEL